MRCLSTFILSLCLCTSANAAYIPPSEIETYRTRMALYVSLGWNIEQVCAGLRRYYGKQFSYSYSAGDDSTHVRVVIGEGNNVTFTEHIGTVKGQRL